jgi:hypothetical protein
MSSEESVTTNTQGSLVMNGEDALMTSDVGDFSTMNGGNSASKGDEDSDCDVPVHFQTEENVKNNNVECDHEEDEMLVHRTDGGNKDDDDLWGEEDLLFQCSLCDVGFPDSKHLSKHFAESRRRQCKQSSRCGKCGKVMIGGQGVGAKGIVCVFMSTAVYKCESLQVL